LKETLKKLGERFGNYGDNFFFTRLTLIAIPAMSWDFHKAQRGGKKIGFMLSILEKRERGQEYEHLI